MRERTARVLASAAKLVSAAAHGPQHQQAEHSEAEDHERQANRQEQREDHEHGGHDDRADPREKLL